MLFRSMPTEDSTATSTISTMSPMLSKGLPNTPKRKEIFKMQEKQEPYDWMIWELSENDPEISLVAVKQIREALDGLSFYWKNHIPLEDMLNQGLPKTPLPIRFTDWQMNHLIGDDDQWEM